MLLLFPLILSALHGRSSTTMATLPATLLRPTRSTESSGGLSLEPSSVAVGRGGTAAFHCAAEGDAHIAWRKDDRVLRTDHPDSRFSQLENGTLVIRSVEGGRGGREDEGLYSCVATKEAGETTLRWISRPAELKVRVLARFVEEPTDRSVRAGETLLLPCRTDASPAPAVRWYKDGSLLPSTTPNRIVLPSTGSLHILRARPEDSGSYRCKVSSADKYRESAAGAVEVAEEAELPSPSPPAFEAKPESAVAAVGESLVLECAANGYPEPQVQWLKDERKLEVGGRLRLEGRGSLLISAVGPSDSGVYTCRATSSLDSQDATATLRVQTPPSITKAPVDVVAKETSDVHFVCEAEGTPGPSVKWYKNAELIKPSQYFVIEGTSLKVLGLVKSDSGVYQCLATNPAGSAQASAQLKVQLAEKGGAGGAGTSTAASTLGPSELPEEGAEGSERAETGLGTAPSRPPPSEPRGLRAARWDARSVSLAWSPPASPNGALAHYAVFYKALGSHRERVLNSTTPTADVPGLQPDSSYNFRVVAFNAHGPGLSSAPLKVRTKSEASAPGVPRSLAAVPTSPDSVHISWAAPDGPVPVSFYKLFYAKTTGPDAKEEAASGEETEIQVSRTSYSLHGLAKFTWYQFRVEAFGGEEEAGGKSSKWAKARTASDKPGGAPLETSVEPADAKTLLVSWEPPAEALRNGRVTGYKIRWKKAQRGAESRTFVTDGSARAHRIKGLEAGTGYQVRVSAMTRNGTGPASEWHRVSTYDEEQGEETVPGPPTSLRVQALSNSILIKWTPPLEDGVLTRGFQIGWGINVPDVESTKVDGTRRYYTIENLSPNRNYIVSLRAFNDRGNGFPIYETVRTQAKGAAAVGSDEAGATGQRADIELSPPIGLRAEAKGATAIRLSWSDRDLPPPLVPGAPQIPADGRAYQIRFKSNYHDSERFHYVNSTETVMTVEGLRPATAYEFNVQAVLERSGSGWSMTAGNRTEAAAPSSAPRDLTATPTDDPAALLLAWQPPRHSNGPITEYLLYYTNRPRLPDGQWQLEGVKGDSLSLLLTGLLPSSTYFFKIQAVSNKGYGPLSTVIQRRTPGGGAPAPGGAGGGEAGGLMDKKTLLLGAGGGGLLLLLLLLCLLIFCWRRKRSRSSRGGYVAGKKTKASKMEVKPPPDLWIHHEHLRRGSADELEAQLHSARDDSFHDLKDFPHQHHPHHAHSPSHYPDSARYQAHSGTLTRSYHQSSGSIGERGEREVHSARQRTPKVVYTGPRGHPPSSVDLDGSALTPTPPPSLPPSTALHDPANGTLTRSANPLKSFSHLTAGLGPPAGETSPRALVRPVPITVASPLRSHVGTSASGKPAGIVVGTKAVASPRAPLIGAHYAAHSDHNPYSDAKDTDGEELQHSYSTEDLNVQMEALDGLMDDLHAMSKNEFNIP